MWNRYKLQTIPVVLNGVENFRFLLFVRRYWQQQHWAKRNQQRRSGNALCAHRLFVHWCCRQFHSSATFFLSWMNKSNGILCAHSRFHREMHVTQWYGVVCCHSCKKFFVFVLATHPQTFSLPLRSLLSFCTTGAFVCAQDAFDSIHKTPFKLSTKLYIHPWKQTEEPANQHRKSFFSFIICLRFSHSLPLHVWCSSYLRLFSVVWNLVDVEQKNLLYSALLFDVIRGGMYVCTDQTDHEQNIVV